jgi:hypothetical protein
MRITSLSSIMITPAVVLLYVLKNCLSKYRHAGGENAYPATIYGQPELYP